MPGSPNWPPVWTGRLGIAMGPWTLILRDMGSPVPVAVARSTGTLAIRPGGDHAGRRDRRHEPLGGSTADLRLRNRDRRSIRRRTGPGPVCLNRIIRSPEAVRIPAGGKRRCPNVPKERPPALLPKKFEWKVPRRRGSPRRALNPRCHAPKPSSAIA